MQHQLVSLKNGILKFKVCSLTNPFLDFKLIHQLKLLALFEHILVYHVICHRSSYIVTLRVIRIVELLVLTTSTTQEIHLLTRIILNGIEGRLLLGKSLQFLSTPLLLYSMDTAEHLSLAPCCVFQG